MGKPSYHGAARQTFGSGALRTPDDPTFNKIHIDKQEKLRIRDERERDRLDDVSSSSLGVLVKQPPIQHTPHKPPGYNTRYFGKSPITHHSAVHDQVLRPPGYGTRRDDMWIRQGISPSRDNVFIGHDDVVMEEGVLLSGSHASGVIPTECDATCGPLEFFCVKSCSCIHSDLHCGKL